MTAPDASTAADLVASADRIGRAVRAGASWHHVTWLTGMAVADALYLAGLGTAADDRAVLVLSLAFAACVAALSVGALPGARVTKAGFPRRWVAAVVGWGVLFGAAMWVGLLLFRGEPAFWLVAAPVTALPLVLGARAEARA
jgi:hypothetical protein